jgi:hypothetical protein
MKTAYQLTPGRSRLFLFGERDGLNPCLVQRKRRQCFLRYRYASAIKMSATVALGLSIVAMSVVTLILLMAAF